MASMQCLGGFSRACGTSPGLDIWLRVSALARGSVRGSALFAFVRGCLRARGLVEDRAASEHGGGQGVCRAPADSRGVFVLLAICLFVFCGAGGSRRKGTKGSQSRQNRSRRNQNGEGGSKPEQAKQAEAAQTHAHTIRCSCLPFRFSSADGIQGQRTTRTCGTEPRSKGEIFHDHLPWS